MLKASSIPNEVTLDNKTVVTIASCAETKFSHKNERLIAFLFILFSKLNYDRTSKLVSMYPASLSDIAMEIHGLTRRTVEEHEKWTGRTFQRDNTRATVYFHIRKKSVSLGDSSYVYPSGKLSHGVNRSLHGIPKVIV